MPRKKKTTAPKAKTTKAVEAVATVEEVAVSVETPVEEKPVETVPVEEITTPVEETVVAIEEAPAPEKKKTTRKASTKKTAEKTTKTTKTTKTAKTAAPAEEKPAEKKTTTTRKSASVNVFFQSHGNESAELVEKAKELSGVKSPKSVNLYIKPEENKVYYVVDGVSGGFEL